MPGAAPVPRGPSVLLLGSAAGLLQAPGCPACRYLAEAGDTYLSWFALDGHHDMDVLTGLCAARGMCAPHTRSLLSQPGAAARLTATYRHVIGAAMADFGARRAACPACARAATAQERVLDLLLEDVALGDRRTYKEHGGLCLPHLRRAARSRRDLDTAWLIRFMIGRLTGPSPDLDLLAGWADPDADARAALLAGRPAAGRTACSACRAAAAAERAVLCGPGQASRWATAAGPADCLCEQHLRAATAIAGHQGLLAGQARLHAARLAQVPDSRPRRLGISARFLSPRARRALAEPDCAVCRGRDEAAAQELRGVAAALRGRAAAASADLALCVRHARDLHAADPQAAALADQVLRARAGALREQLSDAFAAQSGPRRGQPAGPELTAWRRAAAFLDGAVVAGGPPE